MWQGGGRGGTTGKGEEQIRKKPSEGKARHAAWPVSAPCKGANSCGEPENGEKEEGEGRAGVQGAGPACAADGLGMTPL